MNLTAEIVSSDLEELILVNSNDEETGRMSKIDCHQDDGTLHRAFSIFVFNTKGEVLLQKRSEQKMLWPLFWSNACCSHPRAGELSEEAAHRRLKQELGLAVDLTFLYKFEYQARFLEVGSEHELCWVWTGVTDSEEIIANPNEIAEWRFVGRSQLEEEMQSNPGSFTPWMKLEWERITAEFSHLLPD